MEAVILIIMIAVWLLIVIGAIHIGWRGTLRREQKKHRFGPTSDHRAPYVITVDEVRGSGLHTLVRGSMQGQCPARMTVLYPEQGAEKTVLVLKSSVPDMETPEKGIVVELKLFGAKNLRPGCRLTNRRPDDSVETKALGDAQVLHPELPARFPVVVRRRVRDCLLAVGILLIGLFCLLMCVWGLRGETEAGAVLAMPAGLLMTAAGGYLLVNDILFRLIAGEDRSITVRGVGKQRKYHVYNLNWRIAGQQNEKEKLRLVISAPGGRQLAVVDEGAENFETLCRYLRYEADRKKKEERWEWLLSQEFYLPMVQRPPEPGYDEDGISNEDGKFVIPMLRSVEGGTALPVFVSRELLEEHTKAEQFVVFAVTLERAARMTRDFTERDALVIYCPGRILEVKREEWLDIKAYAAAGDRPLRHLYEEQREKEREAENNGVKG